MVIYLHDILRMHGAMNIKLIWLAVTFLGPLCLGLLGICEIHAFLLDYISRLSFTII